MTLSAAVSPFATAFAAQTAVPDVVPQELRRVTDANIYDDAGRFLAGPQGSFERPAGPWDQNTAAAPEHLCAWCTPRSELDRLNALYPALSHGMCSACQVKFEAGE